MSIYNIQVNDYLGTPFNLHQYKNFVLIIVNIASKCTCTKSNLQHLAQIAEKYDNRNLKILMFPSNDFYQEPNNANNLKAIISQYSNKFVLFDKVNVIGKNKHEIFKYLCDRYDNGMYGKMIKWNFTKFLVDRNGNVVKRYSLTENIGMERDGLLEKVVNETVCDDL